MTKENMTVRDAFNLKFEIIDEDVEKSENEYSLIDDACSLVDDYTTLVTLIKKRFGGAVGRVNFKVLENYTSEEVNQMIDNYVEDALIA